MQPDSPWHSRRPMVFLAIALFSVSALGGLIQTSGDARKKSGDPEGAGILPFTGPTSAHGSIAQDLTKLTPGLVLHAQGIPVQGALVIASHPALGIVGKALTNEDGLFVLELPSIANLELALPDEALAGIEVTAGVPIMIFLP